jgi:hypothetical protein
MQFRGQKFLNLLFLWGFSINNSSKQENTDSACMNSPAASFVITTRSDWQSCIFCTNKTYKKDEKLHKVEYCG